MYVGQTSVGILQGLGKTRVVFINNLIGSSTKLIGIYYFVVVQGLGVNGIALGFVIGYGIQAMLDLMAILKTIEIRLSFFQVVTPIGISVVMIKVLFVLQAWLIGFASADMTTLVSVAGSGITYMILLLLFKQFSLKDLRG